MTNATITSMHGAIASALLDLLRKPDPMIQTAIGVQVGPEDAWLSLLVAAFDMSTMAASPVAGVENAICVLAQLAQHAQLAPDGSITHMVIQSLNAKDDPAPAEAPSP